MRGTPLVVMGLLVACASAAPQGGADGAVPVQEGGDSGVQPPPPPPQSDGGSGIDGGVPQPPPATDGGPTGGLPSAPDGGVLSFDPAVLPAPPAPTPDDPATCGPKALPFPDLSAQPDRPCTEEGSTDTGGDLWTVANRYDATGRLVYSVGHGSYGYDSTYTSEDDGGVRVETWVEKGPYSTSTRVTVSRQQDGHPVETDGFYAAADGGLLFGDRSTWQYDGEGRPVESDHFQAAADGGLVLDGHTTWLYDGEGRQQYVITQPTGQSRSVERHLYDAKGHPYYVDVTAYWPGHTEPANHSFTSRSWFANGAQAREYGTCDIVGGAPCGIHERRWEPCGHLAYAAISGGPGLGCHDSSADWSWGADGRPAKSHDNWCDLGGRIFDSTESYQSGVDGKVISGTIVTTNPPDAIIPVPEHQADSYSYDDAGHLIERSLDGKTVFHARYDEAGRLIELLVGTVTRRWTYDGCGRP